MGVERFTVDEAGYKAGLRALDSAANHHSEVIIIDEVGPLELRGQGWHDRLNDLLQLPGAILILAVRKSLTQTVTDNYNLPKTCVVDIDTTDVVKFAGEIAELTAKRHKR